MPSEIGGKKLVADFRSMIQEEVAKALEDGRKRIRGATAVLTKEIQNQSIAAERVILEEAKAVREGFEDHTGNAAPGDDDPEIAAENARLAAAEAAGANKAAETEKVEVTGADVGIMNLTTDGKPNPIP